MEDKKKQIIESLEKNDIEIGDFFEGAGFMYQVVEDCDLNITFDALSDQSEHYVQVTYYSDKLNKTVILDYDANNSWESNEELADAVLRYEAESHELEAKIKI